MIELASRVLMDLGVPRGSAIAIVGVCGLLMGAPSALNMAIFQNQDWVWGVGLMLSGFFFAVAVLRYGVTEWRETFINHPSSDIHIGGWWDWAIRFVVVQAVVLMIWWLWQARGQDPAATWTLFSSFNVGTVLIQWAFALGVFLLLNRWMVGRVQAHEVGRPDARARDHVGPDEDFHAP
jgi:neurotransmitter:Na+ symporter, NSS family